MPYSLKKTCQSLIYVLLCLSLNTYNDISPIGNNEAFAWLKLLQQTNRGAAIRRIGSNLLIKKKTRVNESQSRFVVNFTLWRIIKLSLFSSTDFVAMV
jgi:hypothetical protein